LLRADCDDQVARAFLRHSFEVRKRREMSVNHRSTNFPSTNCATIASPKPSMSIATRREMLDASLQCFRHWLLTHRTATWPSSFTFLAIQDVAGMRNFFSCPVRRWLEPTIAGITSPAFSSDDVAHTDVFPRDFLFVFQSRGNATSAHGHWLQRGHWWRRPSLTLIKYPEVAFRASAVL
jgi:hypothetical protein